MNRGFLVTKVFASLLFLSSCANYYYASAALDFKKISWSLRINEPVLLNYLSENDVLNYDREWDAYRENVWTNSGQKAFDLAAEVDSRNLIRHLINIISSNPNKSEYKVELKSEIPPNEGGMFIPSAAFVTGSDPFKTFLQYAGKEIYSQYSYSDKNGYGEILVGDGAHVIEYWTSTDANWVKISVKNLNGEAVDVSRFNNREMTGQISFIKIKAMKQAIVKRNIEIAKRNSEEAERKYWDNMPSDMTYDPDGNPEWGAYRAERRQEKAAEQTAYQQVIRTLADPNSHIYQNNRMSDQNLAKNFKPKPDEERYGKSSYKEFSKPATSIYSQTLEKYKPSREISTASNNKTNSLKERCLANPKSRWENGVCVIAHEFTNQRNCYDSGGGGCKTGDLVEQNALQPSSNDQTNLPTSSSSSVSAVSNAVSTSKIKGFISDGRTKTFNSSSGSYYKRELARELAQIGIENHAYEFCDSGLRAKIEWIDNGCDKSTSSEQYKCWQRALVLCSSNYCENSFCGTGHTKD